MNTARMLPLFLVLAPAAFPGPWASALPAAENLDSLLSSLRLADPFESQRAEVEIRLRGAEALEKLAAILNAPDETSGNRGWDLRLEKIYRDLLSRFLEETDKDFLSLAGDQVELVRLQARLRMAEKPRPDPAKDAGKDPNRPAEPADDGAEGPDGAGGTGEGGASAAEEIAERIKNLQDRIQERGPRVEKQRDQLSRLLPGAMGEMMKRMETLPPILIAYYQAFFERTVERLGEKDILIDPDSPAFQKRRYILSPIWCWLALKHRASREGSSSEERQPDGQPGAGKEASPPKQAYSPPPKQTAPPPQKQAAPPPKQFALPPKESAPTQQPAAPEKPPAKAAAAPGAAKAPAPDPSAPSRAEELLTRHLNAVLQDLGSNDFRLRERAEDEFFLLSPVSLPFLKSQQPVPPGKYDRLIQLLDWRIQPRSLERIGMDFTRYSTLPFRDRRRLVTQYARVAGRDAIPTLRLVVLDDAKEKNIRIKLAAAEALAGLSDLTGIQALTDRPLPELMKIPEISRQLFLIKGEEYQAQKQYDLAIQEFQKVLDESPFDFDANYRIAFVYLLDKQFKKAIHHFEIARRIRAQDMLTLYNLACAYSLDAQKDKALEALEESVDAGFTDGKHIRNDTDLNPIRGEPRYQRILQKIDGK